MHCYRSYVWAGLLLLSAPAPALADWQQTRWGMSEAEVAAALHSSNVSDVAPTFDHDDDGESEGERPKKRYYRARERVYEASFEYGATGLNRVTLKTRGVQECAGTRNDLLSAYGRPIQQAEDGTIERYTWRDEPRGNLVSYIDPGITACYIVYEPLLKPGQL